jgi:SWIM zinc finger
VSAPLNLPPAATRLLRAACLQADELEPGTWHVTGGQAPHLVIEGACDCPDFLVRHAACKHALAVALARCAPELRAAVKDLASAELEPVGRKRMRRELAPAGGRR